MGRADARLLFALLGGGVAWSAHLLASYAVVAIACANGWPGARPTLVILTLGAAAVAVIAGVTAGRGPAQPAATHTLSRVGGGLNALFTFLIVLGGLVPFMTPLCAVTR